jgi:uncharacterized protein (DUF58 family)
MQPASPEVALPRSISRAGFAATLTGLGLAAFELRYGLLLDRLGLLGRIVLLVCAAGFSVWGVKELIAGWWPALGHRKFARHRLGFPPEGRLYILIMIMLFIGSLIGRSNPLLLVFTLLWGPFVVNGWVSFMLLKRLSVRRAVPRRVMAGELTSVELTLRNDKRFLSAWVILMQDQVTSVHEPQLQAEVLMTCVPPGEERSGRYGLRLMQRGQYRLGPLTLRTRFPLGFVERGLHVATTDSVIVYPRIGRMTNNWRRKLQFATDLVPQQSSRSGPFDDEFHMLREYRLGDDPRAIHWRTTARRSELMIREFHENRDQRLTVLLDAWQPLRPDEADRDRVELAFSLAASVCVHHLRCSRDAHLTLVGGGAPLLRWRSDDGGRMDDLLEGLALHQATSRSDLEMLFREPDGERLTMARTVCVTTRPDVVNQFLRQRAESDSQSLRPQSAVDLVPATPEMANQLVDFRI